MIEKTAYEIAYEADNRPNWIGVPLADLARLAGRIPKDIWLALSGGRLIEICGLVKLLLTIRPFHMGSTNQREVLPWIRP